MMQPKIVIIDYGVGNTHSVFNAITSLGYRKVKITDEGRIIRGADALVLPGVGAFDEAMKNLEGRRLNSVLDVEVLERNKPILGICLGMQMFASYSEENGIHKGLNWIAGNVKKLDLPPQYSIPHVGWNNVEYLNSNLLFNRNGNGSNFYFDHSYHFDCDDEYVAAYCDYGIKVTAAVQHKNISGVQFHPEKSQTNGLKLFRSFFNSISKC